MSLGCIYFRETVSILSLSTRSIVTNIDFN